MSYYIKTGEKLPTAIRRIASEQVVKARIALQDQENRENGIHKARKHFKKLRALVRLVRDDLGEKEYRQQNRHYRDMGRQLSDLRDATSVLESLARLKNRFAEQLQPEVFREIEACLIEEKEKIRGQQAELQDPIDEVIGSLEQADTYIGRLKLSPDRWPNLLSSLKRVYERGDKAHQKSYYGASVQELHEWRKRAKYLWYHYRLLKPAWRPVLKGFARETRHLSDLLGDHRDLALLLLKIDELEDQLSPESVQLVKNAAAQQQRELLRQAQLLGVKIYAEKPGTFKKRLAEYLRNWEGTSRPV